MVPKVSRTIFKTILWPARHLSRRERSRRRASAVRVRGYAAAGGACRRRLSGGRFPSPLPLSLRERGFPSESAQPPLPRRPLAAAALPGRGALHHPVEARAAAGVAAAAVAGDADLEEDGVLVAVDAGLDDALELAAR